MDRETFRRLVDDRVRRISGVGLDDLPDVSLDDYLDDADGIDDRAAAAAALDAAVEILEGEGIDDDVIEEGRRMFRGTVRQDEGTDQ
jgi:hypothetical protein